MAISGGATQSYELQIVGGTLIEGRYAHRQGVEADVDVAVGKLLKGERVFLHAYGSKLDEVKRKVQEALG